MAWTTPKDWETGAVVTEADMDTYVSANLTYLYDEHAALAALAQGHPYTTASNTNAEETVVSWTIDGGLLGTNGGLHLLCSLFHTEGDGVARNFTVRWKFGGNTYFTGVNNANNKTSPLLISFQITNADANNIQTMTCDFVRRSNAVAALPAGTVGAISDHEFGWNTGAVDTSTDQDVEITMQMAVASANVYWKLTGAKLFITEGT